MTPFLAIAGSFAAARVAVLPVPFEASVSYGAGTARGPEAILRASGQVELHDDELGLEPSGCGVWTAPAFRPTASGLDRAVAQVGERVAELTDAGKWVVTLGGEHSITPGVVAALASRHPGLCVFQLDAHADLRESYEGERFSHACAMARCLEHAPVRAVGIRSYGREEAQRLRRGIPDHRMLPARQIGEPGWIDAALGGLDDKPVYLTLDVDYFDPAIVPATGTPEPGGGAWRPTLELLEALFARTTVVACDVVELAPIDGLHHADFTIARLVHRLIGLRFRGQPAG